VPVLLVLGSATGVATGHGLTLASRGVNRRENEVRRRGAISCDRWRICAPPHGQAPAALDHPRMESNNFRIDNDRPTVFAIDDTLAHGRRLQQALQQARFGECLAEVARLAVDRRDAPKLLQEVPRTAAKALDVEHAEVDLLSTDRLSFRVAAGVGLLPGEGIDACMANRPDTLAGRVAAEGQSSVVTASRRGPVFADVHVYGDAGLTSALAVPLFDCGRAIGVLAVRARGDRHFGVEEVRFLETLSSLLAASLQRVRTDEALSHSQGLKSVGQLTGGIAHDFNNLLTVISGNLQVLEDLPAIANDPQQTSDSALACEARSLPEKSSGCRLRCRFFSYQASPTNSSKRRWRGRCCTSRIAVPNSRKRWRRRCT
jgi:hypothetical protein